MSPFSLGSQRRAFAACAGMAALGGCGVPMQSTQLGPEAQPLEIEMMPAELHEGEWGLLTIRSPGADSIVFESLNGVDRYWGHGPELAVSLAPDFGDRTPVARYAERHGDRLLDLFQKPARISVCRRGRCSQHFYDVAVRLPERNRRSVALSAGWSSVFARRSILGADRTVLFKEALTSGVWAAQGEWASGEWHVRAQGFLGGGERGGSVDFSRVLARGDGMSYGLTLHAGMTRSDWLDQGPATAPGRNAYRIAAGPSVMLKGVTASSLLGLYSDGTETLQISSTRVSVNGNLTSVRHPVTLTAEKTFAFGGGAIVSRRRDAVERLTAAIRLVNDFSLNLGMSSHRIAWPEADPANDVRASETLLTLGAQYSLSW